MQGRICVRFQQPAPMLPGPLGHVGYLEEASEAAKASQPAAAPQATTVKSKDDLDRSKKYVTPDMLDQHQEEDSVWFAYQGRVFDGTKFLEEHPGGADSILMAGGTDATDDFNAVHSDGAKQQLQQFYIAEMAPDGVQVRRSGKRTAAASNRIASHVMRRLQLSCCAFKSVPCACAKSKHLCSLIHEVCCATEWPSRCRLRRLEIAHACAGAARVVVSRRARPPRRVCAARGGDSRRALPVAQAAEEGARVLAN